MICVTKAALDSQQKLVIANRLVASPTAAIRYRELGQAPVSICARIFSHRSQTICAQPKFDTRPQ
jgi:hypothetical protein